MVRRAQASRHEAIKVAEMASQGADTIPRVHRFCLESVVRGHHVYKRVWTPVCCKHTKYIGEIEIDMVEAFLFM